MKYSDIKFSLNNNVFTHSVGVDYSLFALWKPARPFISEIRNYLENSFEVLLETEISWTETYFSQNAARLYEVPIFKDGKDFLIPTDHSDKIGDTNFIVFVVKDSTPDYSYAPSVSGNIELSNLSIVKAKLIFREWISNKSTSNYAVHSTNNILEFFSQAPLLLGVQIFKDILKGNKLSTPSIKSDLVGADGWNSYKELFEVLAYSSNYLILRNFETLPLKNSDVDLDILTDSYQHFASITGAIQSPNKPYKATIVVAGQKVPLDIRFIGDGYYCTQWQKDMIDTKSMLNGVYTPREDHYFFSLLYHAKVQKPDVKNSYVTTLIELSKKLNFKWFSDQSFNNENSKNILKGYLQSNDYSYTTPLDTAVYKNTAIVDSLPKADNFVKKLSFKQKSKRLILKVIPNRFYTFYLKLRTK